MITGLFRFIGRVFIYFWHALNGLRRLVFNLVFVLLVAAAIAMLMRPEPPLPASAALVLAPTGVLVEQREIEDPLSLLRAGGTPDPQTSLSDLTEAIEAARLDDRIKVLVIEADSLDGAGLSKLAELRAAIETFKASGKPVLARGERFTQGQYYLASVADQVHLSPDGFVLVMGLSRYVSYFKGALDKLGIKMHVFRVGEFKSFSEPFTRTDMSDEDRANSRDLLDGLWNVFRNDISASRKVTLDVLDNYVIDYGAALAASGGDAALAAQRTGLVDRLSTRDEWAAMLKERVGTDEDGDFNQVSVDDYLAYTRKMATPAADKIAVLVAQGAIVDGTSGTGSVGGDSFAELIREAREDDTVKALVVRIDSPGGSAFASEVIRRELEITRKAGKPVVASMSSTAASGGYWIAAGADEIWAHPATLTGSIGIFAMIPEVAEPLNRLGVTVDGVSTGPLAGAFDPRRPLDDSAAKAMQIGIEHGYRRFLKTVGDARKMSAEEVDLIARGRVWTGETAEKLGLVDGLGGLGAAIKATATRAGLSDYEVVWSETGLSTAQRLMRRLSDMSGIELAVPATRPSPIEQVIAGLQAELDALAVWNDPRHLYVHCLCEAP